MHGIMDNPSPRRMKLDQISGPQTLTRGVHIYNHKGIGTHNSFYSMAFWSLMVVYMDPLGKPKYPPGLLRPFPPFLGRSRPWVRQWEEPMKNGRIPAAGLLSYIGRASEAPKPQRPLQGCGALRHLTSRALLEAPAGDLEVGIEGVALNPYRK